MIKSKGMCYVEVYDQTEINDYYTENYTQKDYHLIEVLVKFIEKSCCNKCPSSSKFFLNNNEYEIV